LERECFADSKARAPKQHNQRSGAVAVGAIPDRAHDRNDLFDRWRIGWVLLALTQWRVALLVARHRRR
jgi:hypothetical protein